MGMEKLKIKHLVLVIIATLGLAIGLFGVTTTTANAAKTNSAYHLYNTIPTVLRGTWRMKGYAYDYHGNHKIKATYTYTINKTSYTMKIDYPSGKEKSKKMTFAHKYLMYIDYRYSTKEYEISPNGPQKYLGYASILCVKPVKHNGKKALRYTPVTGKYSYMYWVHK